MIKKNLSTSILVFLCVLACIAMGYTAYVHIVFDPSAPRPFELSYLYEQWPPFFILPISAILLLTGSVLSVRQPTVATAITILGAITGCSYYVVIFLLLPFYLIAMFIDIRIFLFITVPSALLTAIIIYSVIRLLARHLT